MMLEFLSKNYEWIFSGIGVSIIPYVFYRRKKGSRIFKKNIENTTVQNSNITDSPTSINSNSIKNSPVIVNNSENTSIQLIGEQINNTYYRTENEPRPNLVTINLDAEKIIAEIEDYPPFQVDQMVSNYYGIRVKWKVSYYSIISYDNNIIKVMSQYKGLNYPWIYFYVNVEKYPLFKIAKQGTKIIVTGKITRIKGHEIDLDCEEIEELIN